MFVLVEVSDGPRNRLKLYSLSQHFLVVQTEFSFICYLVLGSQIQLLLDGRKQGEY